MIKTNISLINIIKDYVEVVNEDEYNLLCSTRDKGLTTPNFIHMLSYIMEDCNSSRIFSMSIDDIVYGIVKYENNYVFFYES